jgi:hypothetical protein
LLEIVHRPRLDVEKIKGFYSEKDGVDVRYVCTTAIEAQNARAVDVFFRDTPHPRFGNRYLGLYNSSLYDGLAICDADSVEELSFCMIEYGGKLHYSQHRHDFYSVGASAIDGGRAYCRILNPIYPTHSLRIKDGVFVELC